MKRIGLKNIAIIYDTENVYRAWHDQSAVESALLDIRGVKEAQVSLVDNSVTVDYDEGIVTLDMLREAVEGAGRFEFEA